MKLPSRDYLLAAGLSCPSATIPDNTWQAHLAKHPLGVFALAQRNKTLPWNNEGWDRTEPVVIDETRRTALAKQIRAIEVAGKRCELPELRGKGQSDLDHLACYACPTPVVTRCARICNEDDPMGPRYAAATEELLAALEEDKALVVRREDLSKRLMQVFFKPSALDGLVFLSLGFVSANDRRRIARIVRADGLRSEFYLNGRTLAWRTTYRVAGTMLNERLKFLLEMPPHEPRLGALSDICVVARQWWGTK